jgi:hypothetical protein
MPHSSDDITAVGHITKSLERHWSEELPPTFGRARCLTDLLAEALDIASRPVYGDLRPQAGRVESLLLQALANIDPATYTMSAFADMAERRKK